MAEQFDQNRVVYQPTPGAAPMPIDTFDRQASFLTQLAGEQKQFQGQLINQVGAALDKGIDAYNDVAKANAATDAAAAVTRDGDGMLIAPTSFYPSGLHSRAYADSFETSLKALYGQSAAADFQNQSDLLKAKYPANVAAYSAELEQYRLRMVQGLDPKEAPLIDLRLKAIGAQGATQIGVNLNAQKVQTNVIAAKREIQAIVDDGSRLGATAATAGGPAYNNNVGNITASNDPYAGGKTGGVTLPGNPNKFETFSTPEHGVAAAYLLLKRKVDAAGGMTFEELLSGKGSVKGWDAGAAADVKANYAKLMADAVGLKPTDQVPIGDDAKMAQVLMAQNQFEKGRSTAPAAAFENGIRLAKGDTNAPTTPNVPAGQPPPGQDAAAIATNAAMLEDRWKKAEAQLQQGGYGPDYIAQHKEEMLFSIQMNTFGRQIRDRVATDMSNGVVQGDVVAQWQKEINAFADRFPGRKDVVIAQLNDQLGAAVTQSSRIGAGIQQNQQKKFDADQVVIQRQAQVAADPSTPPEVQQLIRADLRSQTMAALQNPDLNPSMKLKYAAAAQQAGAVAESAVQQSTALQLQGLRQITEKSKSTPQQVSSARDELNNILQAPELQTVLTPGHRQYAQEAVNAVDRREIAGNLGMAMIRANQGHMDPVNASKVIEDGVANGSIGNHPGAVWNFQDANQFLATATAKYTLDQSQQALVASAMQARRDGRPVTDDEKAAVLAKKPFDNGTAVKGTFDINNDTHVANGMAYLDKFQIVPPEMAQAFAAMPRSEDPNVMAPYKKAYDQMVSIARQQGNDPDKGMDHAQVAKWIGDPAANYLKDMGIVGATQAARFANGSGNSVTAQQGANNNNSASSLSTAIDAYTGEIAVANNTRTTLSKITHLQDPTSMTDEEKSAAKVFGHIGTDPHLESQAAITTVSVSQDVKDVLTKFGSNLKGIEGKVLDRIQTDGGSVDQYMAKRAFKQFEDQLEVVPAPTPTDPGHGELRWKQFNTRMAEQMGVPYVAKDAEQGILQGRIDALQDKLPPLARLYDKGTLQADPVMRPGGEMVWNITAHQGGNVISLITLPQKDPGFSALTSQITRTAANEVAKYWTGPPADRSQVAAHFGSLLANMITEPLFNGIRTNKINTIASSLQAGQWGDGWQDNMARTINKIGRLMGGTDGPPKDLGATLDRLQGDKDLAAQIRRWGLLHALTRPTPPSTLAPPVGQPMPGTAAPPQPGGGSAP